MKKIVAIVNPKAGNGKSRDQWQLLEKVFKKTFPRLTTQWTQAPSHATSLTQEALHNDCDCILGVGGDGTLNEIVNGFFDDRQKPLNPKTTLAMLPLGSASDWVKSAPVPRETPALLNALLQNKTTPCDVGWVSFDHPHRDLRQRYFINIASFGIGAQVVLQAQAWSASLGATLAYFLSTAKIFLGTQTLPHLKLITDQGTLQGYFFNVFLANGRYSGGGMSWAPQAQLNDGKLDLVTLGALSKIRLPIYATKLYQGKILDIPEVRLRKVTRLRAESLGTSSPWIEIDGDVQGKLPATFKVLPAALNIVTS